MAIATSAKPSPTAPALSHPSLLLVGASDEQARAAEGALDGTGMTVAGALALDAPWPATAESIAVDVIVLFCVGSRSTTTQAVKRIDGARPDVPLIAVVGDASDALSRATIKAGAAAVVLDDELRATLAIAIDATSAGMLCVPRSLRRQLERHVLSNREKQVLALVVMGYTNAAIASQLFLAESTVKTHLSSIFMKLGVRSRHEAAALILDPTEGLGMGVLSLSGAGVPPTAERGAA